MSSSFITLWSQPQLEVERRAGHLAADLTHIANAQFRARGVEPDDRVYVLAVERGRLLLLGRLIVERIVDQRAAEQHLGHAVYEAPDHLLGQGTALRLDRVVPESVARRIERLSGKHLTIDPDRYAVDVNGLRATGRITEASATLLDDLLDGRSGEDDLCRGWTESLIREAVRRSGPIPRAFLRLLSERGRITTEDVVDHLGLEAPSKVRYVLIPWSRQVTFPMGVTDPADGRPSWPFYPVSDGRFSAYEIPEKVASVVLDELARLGPTTEGPPGPRSRSTLEVGPYSKRTVATGATPSEIYERDPEAFERGLRSHFELEHLVAEAARARDLEPLSVRRGAPIFDIGWLTDEGAFTVVEVKSATLQNLETQLRLGLGQVLQYAYQLGSTYVDVRPALMVEMEPPDPWPGVAAQCGVALAWPDRLGALFGDTNESP